MGTEDVEVTAMNMYKYKEGLRFCKRRPCSTRYKAGLSPGARNSALKDAVSLPAGCLGWYAEIAGECVCIPELSIYHIYPLLFKNDENRFKTCDYNISPK